MRFFARDQARVCSRSGPSWVLTTTRAMSLRITTRALPCSLSDVALFCTDSVASPLGSPGSIRRLRHSVPGSSAGPPDFVGIGAQKAGTTWWYSLIAAHPGVTSRPDIHKERHFLSRFGAERFTPTDIDRYHGWFPRRAGTIAGEWTPDYLSCPWVAPLLSLAAPRAG